MSGIISTLRRDRTIIGIVGLTHFMSHFYQLALPPLFVLMRDELGVSFTRLGAVMFVQFLFSGICQALAGILVDRFGARRVLLAGLSLFVASIGLIGLAPAYWMMLPLAALAGAGNSVFHPADLSILSHNIETKRLGRGFSFHGFAGMLGYASSPVLLVSLALATNWRVALILASLMGLATIFVVSWHRDLLDTPTHSGLRSSHSATPVISFIALVRSPIIIMGFCFFVLFALAGNGIMTYSIPGFIGIFNAELDTASRSLTAYLLGIAAGILLGGILADRTTRHDITTMLEVGAAGVLIILSVTITTSFLFAVFLFTLAGVCVGATSPSRDMLIRRAAPQGATGRVFGLVYSGLDAGSSLSPLLFGWMLDHNKHRMMFIIIGSLLMLTIITVYQFRRATPGSADGH